MATTIGLLINAFWQIDLLDEFEGTVIVQSEEYLLTVEYSLDEIKIKDIQEKAFGKLKEVETLSPFINMNLFISIFLQCLRERKRIFNLQQI